MIVLLEKNEIKYAIELGKKRHNAKDISFRNAGTIKINSRFFLESINKQFYPHIIGVLGEMAYSKVYKKSMDTNIYAVRDGGEDFPGIEIKAITYFGNGEPELKIPKQEYKTRTKINTYVLVRVDKDDLSCVELLGKISRKEFDKKKISKQYSINYPENWVVPLSLMDIL
jgi:hypothetical protein